MMMTSYAGGTDCAVHYGFTTTYIDPKAQPLKIQKERVRKGDRKAYESIWPWQFNRFNRKKW